MQIEAGMAGQVNDKFTIGNTSRHQNDFAEAAARSFSGLPDGVSRWDVLSLVKRLQRELGLTATQVAHLEFLVGYTRDHDWTSGSAPIVYLTVSATAGLRDISERQVCNIERALNRAGLVCWHDSGNQRRFGHRSATGELVQAFGVNLAPLAASYARLYTLASELEHRARIWKQEKTRLLLHKRVLRERMTLNPAHSAAKRALQLICALPRRIEARVTISQLIQWSGQMKELIEALDAVAQEKGEKLPLAPAHEISATAEKTACADPDNSFGRTKTSDRSEIQFRHINTNNTNQTLSNERSNGERPLPIGNDIDLALTAYAEMALEEKHEARTEARQHLQGQPGRPDQPPLPHLNLKPDLNQICSSGIEHITLKQVLACASAMMREMIGNASTSAGADWAAVVSAATLAAGYLGISPSAWQDACSHLGASAAATLIVIAERRGSDPDNPISSYGGFVRGCLAKAKTGDLHLHKSVFGLLNTGNLNE